jgi:hypothetical protein
MRSSGLASHLYSEPIICFTAWKKPFAPAAAKTKDRIVRLRQKFPVSLRIRFLAFEAGTFEERQFSGLVGVAHSNPTEIQMRKIILATALTLMCGSAFAQGTTGPAAQTDNMTKPGMTNRAPTKVR